jgi:hypothetical protein
MDFLREVVAAACAVVLVVACGGSDETLAPTSESAALEGQRVANRDEALQIVARGVVAPLRFSDSALAVLTRAFVQGAGTDAAIVIEAADNAQGLLLRGEPGFVRALLRFDGDAASSAATPRIEGTVVLEVARGAAGEGLARRLRADALSVTEGERTLNWSYLDIEVDAQQTVQRFNVVADVPIDGRERVWLDATASAPGRYTASGVIGFLAARLTLLLASDGGWTIDVYNNRDEQVDFVVQASADEMMRP